MRVWAYGRNISRSNAGRVPLADGQPVADPLRGDAAIAHGRGDRRLGRKLDNFGLIGGFIHQATQAPPAICGPFCIAYLWQQILKSCLKRLRNPVNGRLSLRKSLSLRGAKGTKQSGRQLAHTDEIERSPIYRLSAKGITEHVADLAGDEIGTGSIPRARRPLASL
jgi:hypothetical protein